MAGLGLSREELKLLRALRPFDRLQRFLDEEVGYNTEDHGETCHSPRVVLRQRKAHCMEGAMLAAAAFRAQGRPPLLLDFESVRDDDHVIAVFREQRCWGAVAKSNYAGLRSREPVYRTLRELAISYFEHYYNLRGEKTLRAFSTRPVNLVRFDKLGWMTSEEDVWYIPDYLVTVPHTRLMRPDRERSLRRMDRRLFEAGQHGRVAHG